MRALPALVMASCLLAGHARAEGDVEPTWRFSLGLGGYGVSGPFGDGDDATQAGVVPWFDARSRWVHVDPTGLAVGLLRQEQLQVDVLVGPRLATAEPSDDPANRDMDRDIGVDAGLRAVASLDRYAATLELRSDVSGTSDGTEAVLDLAAGFGPLPGLSLGIDAGVTWQDGNLSTYQYGVLPDEARDGRPAFELDSALTPFAGVQLAYAVTPKVSAVLAVQADFLPTAVTDSPVVERGEVVTSFASVNYAF